MRRLKPTDILLSGLLGCGLALVAWCAITGRPPHWAGQTLVAATSGWAAASLLRLKRRCHQLTDTLAESGNAKLVEPAEIVRAAPEGLGAALSESLAAARRAAVDAELRAKEFEIRLRIAQAEREHAEAIVYSISDAVVVTDPFDDVILANESAANVFNFDSDRTPRTPVHRLLQDQKIIDLIRQMRQAGRRAGRRTVEHQLTHGEETKTYKVTLSTIADKLERETPGPSSDIAGVVAILHDVTHEREIDRLKNDFVSNVSHKLRTPLASIRAYVELLIDGEAQDEKSKREFYDIIQTESNRLGRLIDNVLNLSKIESGLAKVNRKLQSVSDVAQEAVDILRSQAADKCQVVQTELCTEGYRASFDRDMLCQAVLNLLANSIKYTPEGGCITVETSIDTKRRRAILRITDTGVGIAQKDLPFIFDKFHRADANSVMSHGAGLGLPLVKHIVETVHSGRVFVDSQLGKGSCFGFELDLCE